MVINVHAGHNPDGKKACGATGFIRESTEARMVKNEVINQLRQLRNVVYDCTCENGISQADVLTKIVTACNSHDVDLDISIHFNAGAKDSSGDGKTTGVETYVYNITGKAKPYAENICEAISDLGYKNRGVKTNSSLYFLRKTKAPAILIECCFVDDKDDVEIYDYLKMATAIVYGITGERVETKLSSELIKVDKEASIIGAETAIGDGRDLYRVQCGAFSMKENAEKLRENLKSAGYDAIIVKS